MVRYNKKTTCSDAKKKIVKSSYLVVSMTKLSTFACSRCTFKRYSNSGLLLLPGIFQNSILDYTGEELRGMDI